MVTTTSLLALENWFSPSSIPEIYKLNKIWTSLCEIC